MLGILDAVAPRFDVKKPRNKTWQNIIQFQETDLETAQHLKNASMVDYRMFCMDSMLPFPKYYVAGDTSAYLEGPP